MNPGLLVIFVEFTQEWMSFQVKDTSRKMCVISEPTKTLLQNICEDTPQIRVDSHDSSIEAQ